MLLPDNFEQVTSAASEVIDLLIRADCDHPPELIGEKPPGLYVGGKISL